MRDEPVLLSDALNSSESGCRYDTPPGAALSAVRAYEGPVLIDFDETLYLRNSTEDFIDCAWPGLFALILLRVLDALKPWRFTGGVDTRDTWRVCAIAAIFPWTRWRWRSRAPSLAERYGNPELTEALRERKSKPVVLTSGFRPIVGPLLAAMGFTDLPLIASRMYSFADRRRGKLCMAVRELGAEWVARSLAITDSVNDFALLESCARPMRTVWPQARYHRGLSRVYLPGEYVSLIKKGKRYIRRSILMEDFAFWLLSSIGLAVNPTTHVVALLLLLLSFWAIYERGYVDNDLVASRDEVDPKLGENFGKLEVATPSVQPWIWALLAGAAGVSILRGSDILGGKKDFLILYAGWVLMLISTYACFKFYNRLDKSTRVWFYPMLQFARSCAFLVIVPIEPVGVAALGAHVFSLWMPYRLYRLTSGNRWPDTQPALVRLIAFVLLSLMIGSSLGFSALLTWSAMGLLVWNLFRARRNLYRSFYDARMLPRRGGA